MTSMASNLTYIQEDRIVFGHSRC